MFFILLSFESCHLLYRILMIKDDVLNSIDLVLCGCDQHQELAHYPLAGGAWYHFPRCCRGVSKGPVKVAPIVALSGTQTIRKLV